MALTLIVEDGSSLINSNSYATATETTTYFEGHLFASKWTASTTKDEALVHATRLLDAHIIWKGTVADHDQALGWPRFGVLTKDNILIDGDVVPPALKNATAELALILLDGDRSGDKDGVGLKSLKVDVIELEFDKGDKKSVIPSVAFDLINDLGFIESVDNAFGPVRISRV